MFGFLFYLTVAGALCYRAVRLWQGKTSSREVRSGKCIPIYDKVSAVIELIIAALLLFLAVRSLLSSFPRSFFLPFVVISLLTLLAQWIAYALLREDILY